MFELEKCDKIKIDQGFLYLGTSDPSRSVGYLELKPHTSLTLHNRPAIEKLTQIKGVCDMVIYKNGKGEIVTLNENDSYIIKPAGIYHIHTNPYDSLSLTYWDFDGDVTEIIDAIKDKRE